MKLSQFIHPASRQTWMARLVVYIAVVVTLCAVAQGVKLWVA